MMKLGAGHYLREAMSVVTWGRYVKLLCGCEEVANQQTCIDFSRPSSDHQTLFKENTLPDNRSWKIGNSQPAARVTNTVHII